MAEATCRQCRHFLAYGEAGPDEPLAGACRRHPPTPVVVRLADAEGGGFLWNSLVPTVEGRWTCGEWAAPPNEVN